MLLTKHLIFLVTINFLSFCECLQVEVLGKSVIDFVKHRSNPTTFNLLLDCWSKHDVNIFTKALSKHYLQAEIETLELTQTEREQEKPNKQVQMFVADFDCYNSSSLFSQVNQHLLVYPYRWFIFIDNIMDFPQNLPLSLNTRLYLFQKKGQHILTSPYLIRNTTQYKFNDVGTWNDSQQNYSTGIDDIFDDKQRVNQLGLIVYASGVMIHERTKNHFHDNRFLDEDSYTKNNYRLFLHVMEILNTSAILRWHPAWGKVQPNTTKFDNMLGDAQHGGSEFLITIMFISLERLKFLDIISNPLDTSTSFIFRAPPLSTVNNILTNSFETSVWVALILLMFLIYLVLILTVKMEWSFLDNTEADDARILRPEPIELVQFQIGAICQQGLEAEPRSMSGRIITFVALLSLLFFYTAYCACIVALLQSSSTSINKVEHLLQSNIKLGADMMPYTKFHLSNQKEPLKQIIYKTKIAPPNKPENFMPTPVGIENVRTEFFAFHAERDMSYKQISKTFTESEKCGLMEIQFLSEVQPYVHMAKKSIYKEITLLAFCKFRENGLTRRIFLNTYATKPKCTIAGGSFRSVGLFDAYFAMVSYAIGIAMSIVIYVGEMLFKRIRKKDTGQRRRGTQMSEPLRHLQVDSNIPATQQA